MGNKPKTGKIIKCMTCSKEFYIPINRFKTAKFCSPYCRGKSSQKRFINNCHICGKEFSYIATRQGKAKYCSRKCYYKGQKNKGKTIKNCLYCGNSFKSPLSHNRKYCSNKCNGESKKKTKTGSFSFARLALKRRNMIIKCSKCGYDEHPEILGVHHKDGDKKNNNITNFMILCPNCHSLKHKKHIPH